MKAAIAVVFVVLASFPLFSQDSSQIALPEQAPAVETPKGPPLSDNPTAREFAELFTSDDLEAHEAIERAAKKGEKAISGLEGILFSESIRSSRPGTIEGEMMNPNRILVALALEKIGSMKAFDVLIEAAMTHNNVEVRAVALNIINTSYNAKVKSEILKPKKVVVDALLRNSDDSTFIGYLQKPVCQIAQEGLMIWLGLDFGDPIFQDECVKAGKDQKKTSATEYSRLWWKENGTKLNWNKESQHFEAQKK
jgi:hypothetical protein